MSVKEFCLKFCDKIKQSIITTTKGETNLNIMLFGYGVFPALVYVIFLERKIKHIDFSFIRLFLFLLVFLYFIWHLYVIWKTLKVHPEYKKQKKPSKKELCKGKTKEEIKQIEKEIGKTRIRKALLLEGWDTSPNYVIVSLIDIYVLLSIFQIAL